MCDSLPDSSDDEISTFPFNKEGQSITQNFLKKFQLNDLSYWKKDAEGNFIEKTPFYQQMVVSSFFNTNFTYVPKSFVKEIANLVGAHIRKAEEGDSTRCKHDEDFLAGLLKAVKPGVPYKTILFLQVGKNYKGIVYPDLIEHLIIVDKDAGVICDKNCGFVRGSYFDDVPDRPFLSFLSDQNLQEILCGYNLTPQADRQAGRFMFYGKDIMSEICNDFKLGKVLVLVYHGDLKYLLQFQYWHNS